MQLLSRFLPAAVVAAALLPLGSNPASADIIETVDDYTIATVTVPNIAKYCQMMRTKFDKPTTNYQRAMSFIEFDNGNVSINLIATKWSWAQGNAPRPRFAVDGEAHAPLLPWIGNGPSLSSQFPGSLVPKLNRAKRISIGLQEGNVDFDLTGFRPAFEALQRCARTLRSEREQAAAPPKSPVIGSTQDLTAKRGDAPPAAGTGTGAAPPKGQLDNLGIVYMLSRYLQWASDTCGLQTTTKQRKRLDDEIAMLDFRSKAIGPVLRKRLESQTPSDCPSAEVLTARLDLRIRSSVEDMAARLDDEMRRFFQAVADEAAAPPPPEGDAKDPPSADAAGAEDADAAGTETAPASAEELRALAFLAGLIMLDGVERCDMPTTARQRSTIADRVAALRPDMQDVESSFRDIASKEPCPTGDDPEASEVLKHYVDKQPDAFAADLIAKKGDNALSSIRELLAKARPRRADPRAATYLYGLVLRDVINECDIRTTAKQRAGFETKMASLQPEIAALEPALLEKKGPFTTCPAAERIADMQDALPLFIEKSPEDFAAEMDRRSGTKGAD